MEADLAGLITDLGSAAVPGFWIPVLFWTIAGILVSIIFTSGKRHPITQHYALLALLSGASDGHSFHARI